MDANNTPSDAHAPPRIVHEIFEQASWTDDAMLQDMWAGLMSSSCTPDGDDDSNLIFANLLGQMTKLQARILKYACENASKVSSRDGLIHCNELPVSMESLFQIAEETDLQRLDRELDYLIASSLLAEGAGFVTEYNQTRASLTPTPLALHMYVRCQGSRKSPAQFFELQTSR
jgi:hypothetical protein